MSKSQRAGIMTGYAARQNWLKSLEVGQEVVVQRPAYESPSSFTNLSRPSVLASGKIIERNRVSVTVEWTDSARVERIDGTDGWSPIFRTVKIGTTKANGVYHPSVMDARDPSYGLCLFPDYASYRQHEAVIKRIKDSFQASSGIRVLCGNVLLATQRVKVGTTLEEIDAFLQAVSVCF